MHQDHHPPSPFVRREYSSSQHHHPPHLGSTRRQFNEKESYKVEKIQKPEHGKDYTGYILTAGGKEKIYEEDMGHSYKPHYSETPYHSKYSESETMPAKKFVEKSFKKYQYAYSNRRGGHTSMNSGSPKDDLSGFHNTEFRLHSDTPKTRIGNGLAAEAQTHLYSSRPPIVYFNEKTDIYGLKATPWKQLGPNVEISSSAENPVPFQRQQLEAPKEARKKTKTKRVKAPPKNVRTGYMTQQHALYVANNLQNAKPLRSGLFDHNNVLKQSDKFEITDAMLTEAEREEALKNLKGGQKVRIKQESPKDQGYNLQPPELVTGLQYYSQPHGLQYPIVAAPFEAPNPLHGKFGVPHGSYPPVIGTYSKGFIRHIEIETGPSGGKKMVPALIIPLSPEQLNGAYFNHDPTALLHVNQPEVLNPRPKSAHVPHPVHPFPYDIVTPRYQQNEVVNSIVPVENYHFQQQYPAYQYTAQPLEDNFNSYVNYQNQHVYSRVPFNYNPSTTATTPFSPEAGKAAPVAYSTQTIALHNAVAAAAPPVASAAPVTPDTRPNRHNSPYSVAIQQKKQHLVATEQAEAEPKMGNDYSDDSDEKYLSPSEGSYFTTITNTKDDPDSAQPFQKSDARRS